MDYKELANELFVNMVNGPKMQFQRVTDLSLGERRILGFLTYSQNGVTAGELSEKLFLSTPRIASALKSLSKKGYVRRSRDENDKRVVIVTITEEGRRFVKEEHEKVLTLMELTLEKLGEQDAKEFVRIIKRINDINKDLKSKTD